MDMNIVIASLSPVKAEAVRTGFEMTFPGKEFEFTAVQALSGVSDQPMSDDEMRSGALGRIRHARESISDADLYVGLEGGVQEMYGEMYNFGWVAIEAQNGKRGFGRTVAFSVPPEIRALMIHKGLEQSHATDVFFAKSGTKTGTGTIGPLTNDVLTYVSWYIPAVICALVPFIREDMYPHTPGSTQ